MVFAVFYGPVRVAFCLSAFLVANVSLVHAQTADETGSEDVDVEVAQPELRLPPPITIGDDNVLPQKRKVADDTQDPYAAPGLRLGAFTFFPEVKFGGIITSNAQRFG